VSETRLLLVRHAQATSGPDHRWTIDDPLTALGDAQARELAEHLAAMRRPPTRIVSSSALRARQTAAVCAQRLGMAVVDDPRLVEFGSGAISPFTLREMVEHLPYDDIWHPDDPAWDGEPIGAFWRRTAEVSEELARDGGRPLVVSHGGTITGILRWALGIDQRSPDAVHFFVSNASLTDLRLRIDRHGRRRVLVARLNHTAYLGEVTEV
jgi:broad specificity phosphatase PhoE